MNTFQMFSTNVACCKLRLSLVYQLETQCLAFTKIYIYKLKVLIIGDVMVNYARSACSMLTWNVAATAWLQQQMGDLIVSVFSIIQSSLNR